MEKREKHSSKGSSLAREKDVNVIAVGPTGAGKSSLINLFYLWAQGILWIS